MKSFKNHITEQYGLRTKKIKNYSPETHEIYDHGQFTGWLIAKTKGGWILHTEFGEPTKDGTVYNSVKAALKDSNL